MATWYVCSLEDYFEKIDKIGSRYEKQTLEKATLWYRGHEKTDFHLEPGIYRRFYGSGRQRNRYNRNGMYGTIQLKEDLRYQHFMARNYDKISSMPNSVMEWQEIMQHYFTKTRLMDWSESALVALDFALEAYIDPVDNQEISHRRRVNSPVVWVMNPVQLNREIYQCFCKNRNLVRRAFQPSQRVKVAAIIEELRRNQDIYFQMESVTEEKMDGILSLSGLEYMREHFEKNAEEKSSKRGFNPFFYLVLKYYSDGIAVNVDELPPMAMIHPYHSDRIRNQRGAFTVFPYYQEGGGKFDEAILKNGVSPYGMEYMDKCKEYLDKIVIMNPQYIAEQLLRIGEKRAYLYPEMENVSKDFENCSCGI